jgi:hypothetical protein
LVHYHPGCRGLYRDRGDLYRADHHHACHGDDDLYHGVYRDDAAYLVCPAWMVDPSSAWPAVRADLGGLQQADQMPEDFEEQADQELADFAGRDWVLWLEEASHYPQAPLLPSKGRTLCQLFPILPRAFDCPTGRAVPSYCPTS